MDIPYHTEANILGFHITSKEQDSAHKSWTITTARIRAQAQDAYYRDWSLDKRITWLPDGKGMVSSANIPPTRRVRETAEYHDFMVRVERGIIPLTLDHPAKEKRWRRMWPYTHNCQELYIISIPSALARTTTRNCWMVAFMGPDGTEQEPTLQRPDTRDAFVSTSVCCGRGVCDTTRECRIAVNL